MNWAGRGALLEELAAKTLFFVGGAPRSGTTWVQEILNSHPEVCCSGEGFLQRHLVGPMEMLFALRRQALQLKNSTIFKHTTGYPLPLAEDVDFTLRTAILLSLNQQTMGGKFQAIGEKTPENVFCFPKLKQLFPTAKFIGVARDPRDVLSSAWHFIGKKQVNTAGPAQMRAFVEASLPSLNSGFQAMAALHQAFSDDCMIVVYERLLSNPHALVSDLFRFLNVSTDPKTIDLCVEDTKFSTLARAANMTESDSFFRKGVAGDWRNTFSAELGDLIVARMPAAYERYDGWN